jgi:hypothetical protein
MRATSCSGGSFTRPTGAERGDVLHADYGRWAYFAAIRLTLEFVMRMPVNNSSER